AFGQAVEDARDWVRAVVVDDDEGVVDRGREGSANRSIKGATAQIVGAANVQLIVASAGQSAIDLNREQRGRATEVQVARGEDAWARAGADCSAEGVIDVSDDSGAAQRSG